MRTIIRLTNGRRIEIIDSSTDPAECAVVCAEAARAAGVKSPADVRGIDHVLEDLAIALRADPRGEDRTK